MSDPGDDNPAAGEADDAAAAALTAGMAAGDPVAISSFYRRHFDDLYRLARRATRRDESFCLDVVQEATLRVVRTVRPVSADRPLRAWLRVVVQSTALDLLRAERRRAARESAAPPPHPDPPAYDAEQVAWLRAQVAALDPRLAELVDLRYEQRWTLRRIAEHLGLSIGTVDGQLRRTLLDLQRQAAAAFGDDGRPGHEPAPPRRRPRGTPAVPADPTEVTP